MAKTHNESRETLLAFIAFIAVLFSFFPILANNNVKLVTGIVTGIFVCFILITHIKKRGIILTNGRILLYAFFSFWACYGVMSCIWAAEIAITVQYSLYIFVYLFLFIIINQYVDSPAKRRVFFWWMIAIGITYVIIAFWEITSLQHLGISRHGGKLSPYPTGPFYNENTFASTILLIFPFALFGIKLYRNWIVKGLMFLLCAALFLVTIIQSARLAMLVICFDICIFFVFFLDLKKKLISLGIILLFFFMLNQRYPLEYRLISRYFQHSMESLSDEQEQYLPSSMKIRLGLIPEYFEIAAESYLCGIGTGNFIPTMNRWRSQKTFGVAAAHNYIFQIFTENGIIIFLVILIGIATGTISLFFRGLKRPKGSNDRYYNFIGCFLLMNYWGVNFLSGSIMEFTFHWIIFAFCYSLYEIDRDKDEQNNSQPEII